ncbi:MAG: hypothetical protein LBU34_00100 [Planctomycetaceae bacterium]|nr:hypothetical protein [Planctomycetaceae bacterium]
MCITVGGAKRNLRTTAPKKHKPCKGEIMVVLVDNLTPAGFNGEGGDDPAVTLRFTAGYAHHTLPSGVKIIFTTFLLPTCRP